MILLKPPGSYALLDELSVCIEFDAMTKTDHHSFILSIYMFVHYRPYVIHHITKRKTES